MGVRKIARQMDGTDATILVQTALPTREQYHGFFLYPLIIFHFCTIVIFPSYLTHLSQSSTSPLQHPPSSPSITTTNPPTINETPPLLEPIPDPHPLHSALSRSPTLHPDIYLVYIHTCTTQPNTPDPSFPHTTRTRLDPAQLVTPGSPTEGVPCLTSVSRARLPARLHSLSRRGTDVDC